MIFTKVLSIFSEGEFFSQNITDNVQNVINQSEIFEGQVLVFYRHTTGAVLLVEHEIGFLVDLKDCFDKYIPTNKNYYHHRRGFDKNGAAHLRTALMNVSVTIPFTNGILLLGKYQEIIVIDLDSGYKRREIVIQVIGE